MGNNEPTGQRPAYQAANAVCLSCGAPVTGVFCVACGQKNDDLRRSVLILAREFIEDTFSFDSRMWRTLGALTTKPGRVSRAYAHGKRSRYTPPVRLFLVVSFLFFLLLGVTQTLFVAITVHDGSENSSVKLFLMPNENSPGGERCGLTTSLLFFVRPSDFESDLERWNECIAVIHNAVDEELGEDGTRSAEERAEIRSAMQNVSDGVSAALENPAAFNSAFNAWLPRVMLFMTPIAALILTIFIRGPDALFFDHLVFALYGHAVGFVVVGAMVLLSAAGVPLLGFAAALALFVYGICAVKISYGRGWIKTIWTALAGSAIYFIVLFLIVVAIVFRIILQG